MAWAQGSRAAGEESFFVQDVVASRPPTGYGAWYR